MDGAVVTGQREELEALRAELTAGEASDGQHTHNELYEYRMLYHAHAARMWSAAGVPVVKSWRHHDGQECFGGEFFVVVANFPDVGQVSNHYPAGSWDLFAVSEVDLAPEHDGHTPAAAADRLRRLLRGEPAGTGPARAGAGWTVTEEERLVMGARSGLSLDDLAERHARTSGAVVSRLRRGLPPEQRASTSGVRVLTALQELWSTDPTFDWFAPDDESASLEEQGGEDVFDRYYRQRPEGGVDVFDE